MHYRVPRLIVGCTGFLKLKEEDMRIEIKTKSPVRDNDIKALYLLKKALELSSPHMIKANLNFVLERENIKVS
jgi:hypothetical protein